MSDRALSVPARWPVSGAPPQRHPARVGRLAGVLVLVTAGVLGAAAPAEADSPATLDLAAVDHVVSAGLQAASIPGASIAITRGTQVLHVRGYGHDANDVAVTENSRFRIASLSKSFTSLAVLQLVDAGRVSLNDRVVAHLPEFRLADPRGDDITVRQLLDQTSGLADREVPDLSRPQPSTLAEATTSLGSAHLVAPPGTQFNYHNPNYQVAARLVEVVSGQPYDTYLRNHVFRPAGMTATVTSHTDDRPVPSLADGHVIAFGRPIRVPALAMFDGGSGDVISTAADMAQWLVVQANGGSTANGIRLVSTRSMSEMHTPRAPGGYALGWSTHGSDATPTRLEHSGNLLTFSAYQAVLPQSGYGIAILFNSGSALMLGQTAIFHGVLGVIGDTDRIPARPGVLDAIDAVLGSLAVLILALGARGGLTAHSWARRHARSRLQIVSGLAPFSAVIALIAAFPDIAAHLMGGRDVSWVAAAYGWPALVVVVLAALIAATTTLIARSWQLTRQVRNLADVLGRPAPSESTLSVSSQQPVPRSHR